MDHWRTGRDCNRCTSHWSCCWPKTVYIFRIHTIPVQNLAKHDFRKKHSGHLLAWDPQFTFGNDVCGHDYSIDTTDVVLAHYSFFNALSTGSNQTASPVCGHRLKAKGPASSLILTVVDRCEYMVPTQPSTRNWTIKQ